jgi:hypothetical protein
MSENIDKLDKIIAEMRSWSSGRSNGPPPCVTDWAHRLAPLRAAPAAEGAAPQASAWKDAPQLAWERWIMSDASRGLAANTHASFNAGYVAGFNARLAAPAAAPAPVDGMVLTIGATRCYGEDEWYREMTADGVTFLVPLGEQEKGREALGFALDAIAARKARLAAPTSAATPEQHCQNGRGDICARRDGITCPADSCDIDDGIYKQPEAAHGEQGDGLSILRGLADELRAAGASGPHGLKRWQTKVQAAIEALTTPAAAPGAVDALPAKWQEKVRTVYGQGPSGYALLACARELTAALAQQPPASGSRGVDYEDREIPDAIKRARHWATLKDKLQPRLAQTLEQLADFAERNLATPDASAQEGAK